MRPPPRFVLLDGGVGHILKSADPKGHLNFLGGALAPASAIREAHRSFVEAGAEILTTATFGVTANSLRRAGLPESGELEAITRRVARLAVEVAAEENKKGKQQQEEEEGGRGRGRRRRRVLVAGCLPPLGENCYLPSCPPDEESAEVAAAAAKVYERIAAALLEAGVDLFLVETCSGGADAEAAVRGASAAVSAAAAAAAAASSSSPPSPPPPLWLSFTVDDEDPSRLRGGEGLEAAARRALLEPATGGGGGGAGGAGGGGREEEAEYRIPISALLLNCSSPRAVSAALPLLHRAVSEGRRREKGTREEEEVGVGIGGYANGFRLSTTSWLRSEGGAPLPPAAVAVPAPASDAAAREGSQEEDDDYDDEGMIRPEAYARHAAGWLRSCCCRPRRGGSGGEGEDGGDGEDGGGDGSRSGQEEESCCLFPSSSPSFFVLGGCCGVGPDHVRVLRSLLDSEEEEEEGPPL